MTTNSPITNSKEYRLALKIELEIHQRGALCQIEPKAWQLLLACFNDPGIECNMDFIFNPTMA